MPPAIEISALTKRYRANMTAVADLSLTIPTGQVLAFLGPNGAGKTTTIKMICGLITPTSGTVTINGFHVSKRRRQAMRQMGVVLEGTRNIYWRLPAWENLMYFGHLKGVSGKVLHDRAERLLRQFNLWDRRRDEAGEFSRGMQQKLAIACALIADPPIILLDEPTLGLDVQAARTVREQVAQLAQEDGKTIVLTTHQLSMAQEVCEQVAIINKGRLITNQPVKDLLHVFEQAQYYIKVAGQVDRAILPEQFSMDVTVQQGETVLSGLSDDQDCLNTILNTLHEHQHTLLTVQRTQPTLEDIFVHLTDNQ